MLFPTSTLLLALSALSTVSAQKKRLDSHEQKMNHRSHPKQIHERGWHGDKHHGEHARPASSAAVSASSAAYNASGSAAVNAYAVPVTSSSESYPTTSTEAAYTPATTSSSKKTSTSAAAAATTTASSSSSSTIESGGVATYFYQYGVAGACGTVHADSAVIAAIPSAWYGDSGSVSEYCGKEIIMTAASTGQTITVTVADECPSCENSNSIDLSIGAMSLLAGSTDYTEEGEYSITWYWA